MDKGQQMRYNDAEFKIIKNTFAENDELIYALRKALVGLKLSKVEQGWLKVLKSDEVMALLRKHYLPQVDCTVPLLQLVDLISTVKIEDRTPEDAVRLLEAEHIVMDILDKNLKALVGEGEAVDINTLIVMQGKDADVIWKEHLARNTLISRIEQQTLQLLALAGKKDDSVDQTKEAIIAARQKNGTR